MWEGKCVGNRNKISAEIILSSFSYVFLVETNRTTYRGALIPTYNGKYYKTELINNNKNYRGEGNIITGSKLVGRLDETVSFCTYTLDKK